MPSAQYALGYDPQKPPKRFEPPRQPLKQELKDGLLWMRNIIVCALVIWVCFALVSGGYEAVDSSGWIQHQQETKVSWKSGQEWIVGEYRTCTMANNASTEMSCAGSDGNFSMYDPAHLLNVRYWVKFIGRMLRRTTGSANAKKTRCCVGRLIETRL
jgi:hypothetical protein